MTLVSDRRINPRIHRCGDYFLYPDTKDKMPCELKNISVTGACIESVSQLLVNQIVDLHVCRDHDMTLRSEVVWIKDTEYGLRFLLDTPESFTNISYIMNNEYR